MGDMVLEAVVGDVVERVISLAVDEIGLLLCVKGEVENLRTVLTSIQAVLQDAEEKQVKKETVKVWLQELKQVAYDAEDVLDEITYEKLKYEIINKACRWFSPIRLIVHVEMAHKIKAINGRLDVIEKNKNRFQLEPNQSGSSSLDQMTTYDRETSSFVDDSTVIGRESEKKEIIQMLINEHDGSSSSSSSTVHQEITGDNTPLSVICIVGLGGLGKTTLAQLVYNNDAVKKHFNMKVWICVSDHFNTKNLFAQILKQINPNNSKPEPSTKQELENDLQSHLQGNKILLVLDDVWNEDQEMWENLLNPLRSFSARGSKFIVTSRSQKVASAARATMYQLLGLSDNSCWGLIERRAFVVGGPVEKTTQLVRIGEEISKKCKGVPLAAKVLGGMLQSKKQEQEWLAVRDADFTSDGRDPIMEVLKLSYYNLPSTLKSCFSYCAIFPKDHWIYRETLIELWMSQGLLGASDNRGEIMEDKGNTYFDILYSKSLFQEAELNKYGEIISCKMHDLLNDLAQSVCKFECHNFGENMKMSEDLFECRHASFISPARVRTLCKKAKKVRTIFGWKSDDRGTVGVTKINTFFKFKLLRVLDLSGFRGSDFSSSSLDKLKHLRYLDLSETSIKSLPKWVTQLYQLQTLKLIKCYMLKELPENLTNLKKLRHLLIDNGKKWKKMPKAMGKLDELRTLPIFVACKKNGISALKNLKHLQGTVEIRHLGRAKKTSLAEEAKLIIDKVNLRELSLHWDSDDGQSSCVGDSQVLKELQPHRNLKELSVVGFRGVEFPGWVSNGSLLPHLVAMEISHCSRCEHIPSFGGLPSLERLEIRNMGNVKSIGSSKDDDDMGMDASITSSEQSSYGSLKMLSLEGMRSLEEWSEKEAGILFPCLEELSICHCPNLERTPHLFPSLKSFLRILKIWQCVALKSIPDVRGFTSLQQLDIRNCEELETIPKGFLSSLVALESLTVSDCDRLKGTIELSPPSLKHLQHLHIVYCRKLQGLDICTASAEQEQVLFPCCHTLKISGCHAISSIDVRSFASLRVLEITKCRGLQALQGLPFLTALQTLTIGGFSPALRYFPFFGEDDDDDNAVQFNNLFPSLRNLWLQGWDTLQSLPHRLQHFTMLKVLTISNFPNLTVLPEWLGNLAYLKELNIWWCDNLTDLPSKEQMQRLTFLKKLYIRVCPHLKERCIRDGPEWPKISHIPNLVIKDNFLDILRSNFIRRRR